MEIVILARKQLCTFVEGRALRTKSAEGIFRFILEDIFSTYGTIGRMRADQKELDATEARQFFGRHGVKLRLTIAYNPEANGKSERRHPLIINALVKACKKKPKQWPRLLAFALWADRTTHNTVTGYMPIELIWVKNLSCLQRIWYLLGSSWTRKMALQERDCWNSGYNNLRDCLRTRRLH